MEQDSLEAHFRNAYPRMDYFFHTRIAGKFPQWRYKELKKELIQRTSLKIMEDIQREKLDRGYGFNTIVKLCMNDIWSDFVKEEIKNRQRFHYIAPEILEEALTFRIDEQYEINQTVDKLLEAIKPKDRELVMMELDGFTYTDIATVKHKSYDAIKVKMNRIHNNLKKMFPDSEKK